MGSRGEFFFNLGPIALKHSTLLTRINQNRMPEAAEEFLRWTHADGKELPGLVARRKAERELFLKEN